jgi:hypothetical protein
MDADNHELNYGATYVLNRQSIRVDHGRFFVLRCGRRSELNSVASMEHVMEMTVRGWRAWVKTCALQSFATEVVLWSALCLKPEAAYARRHWGGNRGVHDKHSGGAGAFCSGLCSCGPHPRCHHPG